MRSMSVYLTAWREFPGHSTGRRTQTEPSTPAELKDKSEFKEAEAARISRIECQRRGRCTELQRPSVGKLTHTYTLTQREGTLVVACDWGCAEGSDCTERQGNFWDDGNVLGLGSHTTGNFCQNPLNRTLRIGDTVCKLHLDQEPP